MWCIILHLQFREKFDVRVIFPNTKDDDQETITIVGKKESVEKAKDDLLQSIKELASSFLCFSQDFDEEVFFVIKKLCNRICMSQQIFQDLVKNCWM